MSECAAEACHHTCGWVMYVYALVSECRYTPKGTIWIGQDRNMMEWLLRATHTHHKLLVYPQSPDWHESQTLFRWYLRPQLPQLFEDLYTYALRFLMFWVEHDLLAQESLVRCQLNTSPQQLQPVVCIECMSQPASKRQRKEFGQVTWHSIGMWIALPSPPSPAAKALDLAHRWQLDHIVEALETKLVKDHDIMTLLSPETGWYVTLRGFHRPIHLMHMNLCVQIVSSRIFVI